MSAEPTEQGDGQETPVDTQTQPQSQRTASPGRAARSTSAIPQLSRSRKNSQEFSPTRNNALSGTLSTIPSAAAVQRALSAQRPLVSNSNLDGAPEASRIDRKSGSNSPAWPTSPRLKSPPPLASTSRHALSKKPEGEQTPSNTSLKRLATVSSPETSAAMRVTEPTRDQPTTQVTPRATGRGPSNQGTMLETVAEGSAPTTPSIAPMVDQSAESYIDARPRDKGEPNSESSTIKDGEASGESGLKTPSDVKDGGQATRTTSSSRPNTNLAKRSLTSLTASKARPPEPPRTMTVETEPVTSMPQLIVGERGLSGRDGSGSVRTKPSSEAMKPKKEKKKTARKAATGTGEKVVSSFHCKATNNVSGV